MITEKITSAVKRRNITGAKFGLRIGKESGGNVYLAKTILSIERLHSMGWDNGEYVFEGTYSQCREALENAKKYYEKHNDNGVIVSDTFRGKV